MANGKRGREKLVIVKTEMQAAIYVIEKDGPLPNRGALWAALENSDWAKGLSPRPLTAQVAMVRAKEFAEGGEPLDIKTPLGKRGGDGTFGGKRGRVKGQAVKRKGMSFEAVCFFADEYPQMVSTVEKAEAGSLKSAVKLKCLDCSGGSKKEVALCTVRACALYGFRPYQKVTAEMSEAEPAVPDEAELVQIG
jgi:hypothetical protein